MQQNVLLTEIADISKTIVKESRKAIKALPFMAFRKPKSLRDYLVHAKLPNRLTVSKDNPGRQNARSEARRGQWCVEKDDARSLSTWNREKGLPLTELERVIYY